jgi:general stress protein 13
MALWQIRIKNWELFQMARKYEAGEKLTGKVTGIQPYGAFVSLDENTQGLVHISEITYGFVKDVNEFLSIGEKVEVKVLEVNEEAEKISLSIRALQEKPVTDHRNDRPRESLQERIKEQDSEGFNSLKEKLQDWIEQSGQ